MSIVKHFIFGPFWAYQSEKLNIALSNLNHSFTSFTFFTSSFPLGLNLDTIPKELSETRQRLLQAWCVAPNGSLIIDWLHELFRWSTAPLEQWQTRPPPCTRAHSASHSTLVKQKGLLMEPNFSSTLPFYFHTMGTSFVDCALLF